MAADQKVTLLDFTQLSRLKATKIAAVNPACCKAALDLRSPLRRLVTAEVGLDNARSFCGLRTWCSSFCVSNGLVHVGQSACKI